MAKNVEIKAKLNSLEASLNKVKSICDAPPELMHQTDTFFHCKSGRLKLREFGDGHGLLIAYHRANSTEPTASDYQTTSITYPGDLKEILAATLNVQGVVRKTRHLYITGRTRIHLDEVEGLGNFLELEVVMSTGESIDSGSNEANELMQTLDIQSADLISVAYIDLLLNKTPDT